MNLKLIALLLISFAAVGSIVYQVRNRRPKAPISPLGFAAPPTTPASAPTPSAAVPAPPPQNAAAPAAGTVTAVQDALRPNIPANGWGRNPFLTREEINRLNQPPVTEIVQTSAPPPPVVVPAGPPSYAVTAIIYGPNGSFAVVNSRVVQTGDRVGTETVKEIKSGGVVLESEGRTRILPLRRLGPDIQLNVPKGD